MGKIDLDITSGSLLIHAENALKDQKLYLTVQNLNDALDKSVTPEERKKVFLAFADLFLTINNRPLARYALYMADKMSYKGGYSSFDFARFLPEPLLSVSEEEDEALTAKSIVEYNRVYSLICSRKYTEALKAFFALPMDKKGMASIVDALTSAINNDKDFVLDTYLISLLPVVGEYAAEDPQFIQMLLSGGDNTKALAVEGARFFIEGNDDVELLRDIGEVYYLASEFSSAELFFQKALSLCEIDETSLFYMYAISVVYHKAEDAARYRARYYTVTRFAMPPMVVIDLNATTADRDSVSEYLTLTERKEEAFFKDIYSHINEELDEKQFVRIKQFACAGNPYPIMKIFTKLSERKEKDLFLQLCNAVMESPFVTGETKSGILSLVIKSGCDGTVCCCTPEKALVFDVAKFRHRYGIWNEVYSDASEVIIKNNGFVPYRSELMAAVIKKCKQKFTITFDEDYDFYLFVAVLSYVSRLTENVSISSLMSEFHFFPGDLEVFLQHNAMESPVL